MGRHPKISVEDLTAALFPIIPPQVNGATVQERLGDIREAVEVSNYSAPSEWGDDGRQG